MLTKIEALRYRCLRDVSRHLGPVQVLVGANASGKSTFLDIPVFLGDLVRQGIEAAVESRTSSFHDLVWGRQEGGFELAVEAAIPSELVEQTSNKHNCARYEVKLEFNREGNQCELTAETLLLFSRPSPKASQRTLFPHLGPYRDTLLRGVKGTSSRTVVNKSPGGNDNFYDETRGRGGGGWLPSFRLGPRKSALANLPDDPTRFPVATWFRGLMSAGMRSLQLESAALRSACRPGLGRELLDDGSNLAWAIHELESQAPDRLQKWLGHVRTALPEIAGIRTVERPEDRFRYLLLRYQDGLEVPSWMTSDGTLRLLALTLPAYMRHLTGVLQVEEPENGIHPRAAETVFQSLTSIYEAQVMMATHSPVILNMAEPEQVLCFAKDDKGATDIVRGDEHPHLRQWRGEVALGTLFAAGVLG